MEISIIGTGSVGETLGRGLADAGHTVVFGSRRPDDPEAAELAERAATAVTTQTDAARVGDAVVLAVPGDVAPAVTGDLADAIGDAALVDATNSMERTDESLAGRIADAAPEARVVKAFNAIGTEGMADPSFDGDSATTFVASDDPDAKGTAVALARDLGFEVVDAGDLGDAILLEDLARLWIHLSRSRGRRIAFRLLEE